VGIKLDWQVEAERVYNKTGEDPETRRRRRQKRLQILFVIIMSAGIMCALGALVWYRLFTVDNALTQALIDTVQAETAAIRIGDFPGFISIQRSQSGAWTTVQSERYKRYQDLKTNPNTKLTGNVLATAIDGSRGRAVVQEIIDGVPYRAAWFYWRYSDGWRHVPSDFTFWGDEKTIMGKFSTLTYKELDETLAQALAPRLDRWWSEGCGYLGCMTTPKLTVRIVSDPSVMLGWDTRAENTLLIPSPLAIADRVRSDVPIADQLEDIIAAHVAERVFDVATGKLMPVTYSDSAWLRKSIIDWLSATYTGRGDLANIGFVQSLKDNYGVAALAKITQSLSPASDISLMGKVLNQPIESLALDWRAFFQRRLDIEKQLVKDDQTAFQALWDTSNPVAQEQMLQRLSNPNNQPATPQVQAVAINTAQDGIPIANIQATVDGQGMVIVFRLVDGSWKRSA
jgi:hypothetical protein